MVGETTGKDRDTPQSVLAANDILSLQKLTREVPAPENVVSYAVRLAASQGRILNTVMIGRIKELNGEQVPVVLRH